MRNKVAKLALVSTSLVPIFLTLGVVEFSRARRPKTGVRYLLTAVFGTSSGKVSF